jgi:alpha-tubulin suppressor-like RCC1 family protein
VLSTHYKVEINLNREALGPDYLLNEDLSRTLVYSWEQFRPINRVAHYHVVVRPRADFTVNRAPLFPGKPEQANWLTHYVMGEVSLPGAKVFSQNTATRVWAIPHNLGTTNIISQFYDEDLMVVEPETCYPLNRNIYVAVFSQPTAGFGLLTGADRASFVSEPSDNWFVAHNLGVKEVFSDTALDEETVFHRFPKEKFVPEDIELVDDGSAVAVMSEGEAAFMKRGFVFTARADHLHVQETPERSWVIHHECGHRGVIVQVYDEEFRKVSPRSITLDNRNYCTIQLDEETTGYAVVKFAGTPSSRAETIRSLLTGAYFKLGSGPGWAHGGTLTDVRNEIYSANVTEVVEEDDRLLIRLDIPHGIEVKDIREVALFDTISDRMHFYTQGALLYKQSETVLNIEYEISHEAPGHQVDVPQPGAFHDLIVLSNLKDATWRIVGTEGWVHQGVFSLSAGTYEIEFVDVEGYVTPDPLTVVLAGNSEVKGEYVEVTEELLPTEIYGWGDGFLAIEDIYYGYSVDNWFRSSFPVIHPLHTPEGVEFKSIRSNDDRSVYAVSTEGQLWAVGENTDNQFGLIGAEKNIDRWTNNLFTSPDNETGNFGIREASCGRFFLAVLKEGGSLYTSGMNWFGQLGTGDTDARHGLTRVGTDSDWKTFWITGEWEATFAIKEDGSLWACGRNTTGQLGLGDINNRNRLTLVPGGGSWVKVRTGSGRSVALTEGGVVYYAGYGFGGTIPTRNVYTQVPSEEGSEGPGRVVDFALGYSYIIVLNEDGELWGIGGQWGELGLGNTVPRYVWTKLPLEGVIEICGAGGNGKSFMAILEDRTLWGAGSNSDGELGLPELRNYTTFHRIGNYKWGHTSVSHRGISMGKACTAAQRKGRLLVWGDNGYGELGSQGDVVPSPVHPREGDHRQLSACLGGDGVGGNTAVIDAKGELWFSGRNEENFMDSFGPSLILGRGTASPITTSLLNLSLPDGDVLQSKGQRGEITAVWKGDDEYLWLGSAANGTYNNWSCFQVYSFSWAREVYTKTPLTGIAVVGNNKGQVFCARTRSSGYNNLCAYSYTLERGGWVRDENWALDFGVAPRGIIISPDGRNPIFYGQRVSSVTHKMYDAVDGNVLWARDHGATVFDMATDEEGNIYTAGERGGNGIGAVKKWSPDGALIWQTTFSLVTAQRIHVRNGMVAVACTRTTSETHSLKVFDTDGNHLWSADIGSNCNAVLLDSQGNAIVMPTSSARIRKYAPGGTLVWGVGTTGSSVGGIALDLEDNVYAYGTTYSRDGHSASAERLDGTTGATVWRNSTMGAVRSGYLKGGFNCTRM